MLKGRNVFLIYFLVSKHNTSIKHQYLDPYIYSFVEEADDNISRYCRLTFVALSGKNLEIYGAPKLVPLLISNIYRYRFKFTILKRSQEPLIK